MMEYIAIAGIPIVALIAFMASTQRNGITVDPTTGAKYQFDPNTGLSELIPEHVGGYHQDVQHIETHGLCPTCNHEISSENHFCPGCGKRIK